MNYESGTRTQGKAKKSLLLKIVGDFSAFMLLAILGLMLLSTNAMRSLSLETGVSVGEWKLRGDITSFEHTLHREHGTVRMEGGRLVDQHGNSVEDIYHADGFEFIDAVGGSLGLLVTVFVREGNDFRSMASNLILPNGQRAVGTFFDRDNVAFPHVSAGREYIGIADVLGFDHLTMYRPLFQPGTNDVIGVLFMGIDMRDIEATFMDNMRVRTRNIRLFSALILIASILLTSFTVRLIVLKPIRHAVNMLREISQGEGDLTKKLMVKNQDEIGEMAYYFNLTLDKIKKLVITIKRQSATLSGVGENLSGNITRTAAAINQIAANIQNIKGRVINQSAGVTETNATMEQVTENIDRLNGHIEKQSTAVSESSAAVEEMIASIRSVTDTVSRNSANVKTLERASDAGRTSLRGVVADIQEIARESESLLEINSVMENIAGKTNLLSMNAAIEAAKAGEVGKGFAVVAGEIRKLSISSEEQSKTVSTVLKKIKDSIDKITMSTEDVQDKFEAIDSGVKIVADQEEIILHTMEEQMRGSKQILQAIGQVNEITGHVKGGSARMLEGSREVIRESRNLETITREINGGMNEMSLGANQIDVAVSQVTGLGAENGKSIDTLLAEVSRFKVD